MRRLSLGPAVLAALMALVGCAVPVLAQQRVGPRAGYVYPAGGRQGATVEVTVGGQGLGGAAAVFVTGGGVTGTVGKFVRPLTPQQVQSLRDRLEAARRSLGMGGQGGRAGANLQNPMLVARLARAAGITDDEVKALTEFVRSRSDPKRQLNPQLQERLALRIEIAPDAAPGDRELRVLVNGGLTNPVRFRVGQPAECQEGEPNDRMADACIGETLPVVVNGQVLPGDVDRFLFTASKGAHIVVAVAARALMPYLADTVPGWFQAVASVRGPDGNEVAYADGFRFSPDPVLGFTAPADGPYTLEIRDALYRGREDFVYRVTVGELPYVTSIYPLAVPPGRSTLSLSGWNLPSQRTTVDFAPGDAGPRTVRVAGRGGVLSNEVPCLVDASRPAVANAKAVALPTAVVGCIARAGETDTLTFTGRAGQTVVAEVTARRLGSPLDAHLTVVDPRGRSLGANDDWEDRGAGLVTHQADSRVEVRLPASGTYRALVRDAQGAGGPAYAYRLRVGPLEPDFELRVCPASVNVRAGSSTPVTVHVLRRDGFAGEVRLSLKGAPSGLTLEGGRVPAGQDRVRVTLTAVGARRLAPLELGMRGEAAVAGRTVRRDARPCDDLMQAFAYQHLVPRDAWMVAVVGRAFGPQVRRVPADAPAALPAGGTTILTFAAPAWLLDSDLRLTLSDPPDGIEVVSSEPVRGGIAVRVRAVAGKQKAGAEGNLVFEASRAPAPPPAGGAAPTRAATRRLPLGHLPAVPYRVVASGL